MARNIELKARIENIAGLTVKVSELADKGPVENLPGRYFLYLSERTAEAAHFFRDGSGANFLPTAGAKPGT